MDDFGYAEVPIKLTDGGQGEILRDHVRDGQRLAEPDPADRAQILRELPDQMREEAQHSGLPDTVESSLRTRPRDLLGARAVTVEQALP